MKVVQLLLPGAGPWDAKCHRADAGMEDGIDAESWALELSGTVVSPSGARETVRALAGRLRAREFGLLHVYGSRGLPARLVSSLPIPWLANRPIDVPRSLLSRPAAPAKVLATIVPEVVDSSYFAEPPAPRDGRSVRIVASLARGRNVRRNWEQTLARIQRVRTDVDWRLLDREPSPKELAAFDLWVDPSDDENDFDGFVCEAMASGVPVVAARTQINRARTDDGRAGVLARPGDYNELAHSILGMLFKDEVAEPRRIAAEEFRETFRLGARRHLLAALYREIGK